MHHYLMGQHALGIIAIFIPHIPNKTFLSSDGKYYFLGVETMNRWMRKTFGCQNPNLSIGEYLNTNSIHIDQNQIDNYGSNLPDLINGMKGIYSFVSYNKSWATGHADLLNNNSTCDGGCYFNGPIQYIDIWKLQ